MNAQIKRDPLNEDSELVIKTRTRPNAATRRPERTAQQAVLAAKDSRPKQDYAYQSASLWSHLVYGLGALAAFVIPLRIPGITLPGLVIIYLGVPMVITLAACVWGVAQGIRVDRKIKQTRHRRRVLI